MPFRKLSNVGTMDEALNLLYSQTALKTLNMTTAASVDEGVTLNREQLHETSYSIPKLQCTCRTL